MEDYIWLSLLIPVFVIVPILIWASIPYSKMQKFKETFRFKNSWFKICFSLSAAILGFVIMDEGIFGKVMGAILFFAMGLLLARLLEKMLSNVTIKSVVVIIKTILCCLLLWFAVTRKYGEYKSPYSNSENANNIGNGWDKYDYDDDGDINQNEWEDALGDYMDDAMN